MPTNLTRKLRKSYAKRFRDKFIFESADYGLLLLDSTDSLSREIYSGAAHEVEERACFLDLIAAGTDVFLDIGANLGLYTLAAAKAGVGEIHAFEPNPWTWCQLSGNIFLNDLCDRVRPWNVAASDTDGQTEIHVDRTTSAVSTLSPENMPGRWAYDQRYTCETRALDGMFPWSGRRLLVKLDVEGHEIPALKGMANLIRDNKTDLLIEVLGGNAAAFAVLENLGLECVRSIGENHHFSNRRAFGDR